MLFTIIWLYWFKVGSFFFKYLLDIFLIVEIERYLAFFTQLTHQQQQTNKLTTQLERQRLEYAGVPLTYIWRLMEFELCGPTIL